MRGFLSIIIAVLLLVGFPAIANATIPAVDVVYDGRYAGVYGYYVYFHGSGEVYGVYDSALNKCTADSTSVRTYTDWSYYRLQFTPISSTGITYPNVGDYKPVNLAITRQYTGGEYLSYNLENSDGTLVYRPNSTTTLVEFRNYLGISPLNTNTNPRPWSPSYCDYSRSPTIDVFELVPYLKPDCDQTGFLQCIKNHFASKFPFDIFMNFSSVSPSCPKVAFFEQEYDICWVYDAVKWLKYPMAIGVFVKLYQHL